MSDSIGKYDVLDLIKENMRMEKQKILEVLQIPKGFESTLSGFLGELMNEGRIAGMYFAGKDSVYEFIR